MVFIVAEWGESQEKTWAGSQGIKALRLALPLSGCYLGQRSTLARSLLLIHLINGEPASCFVSYSVPWTTRCLAHSVLSFASKEPGSVWLRDKRQRYRVCRPFPQ